MDNNNLSKLSEQITKNTNEAIEKISDSLYKEFVENVPRAKMSEIVFKEYFLEFFEKGAYSDSDAPLTLKWLEISGGPYNEVDIVDNNGNVLFTTPGLYARPQAKQTLENMDLDNIATNFNLKANRLYNDGLNYLKNQIGNLNNDIVISKDEHALRWKNIFLRYKNKDNNILDKVKPKLDDNISSFLDYD